MAVGVADHVRGVVEKTATGGFIHSRDLVPLVGSRAAVDTALHRLTATGALVSVRPGLYFKGKRTRFGITRPDPLTVGFEVAKGRGFATGVGPAGVSAARWLGLTSQVPAVEEVAVPGRAPAEPHGVRYRSRAAVGRQGLGPVEVAVLEMLREWPRYCEASWSEFVSVVARLCLRGAVDVDRIKDAAAREHHVAARERAAELADAVHTFVAP
jgi:hypothetical protein